jgi:hypothetical protein
MFEYIDKKIKILKLNFIKRFIEATGKNGFKLVYVKDTDSKENSIKDLTKKFDFLIDDEIFDKTYFYNIDEIRYFFNKDKEIFLEQKQKLIFDQITNHFLTENNEYNQILFSNFLKYIQMGNILETYMPDTIIKKEIRDIKYFMYSLISNEDNSLQEIVNPYIISNPWSINRLSKEEGIETFNLIKTKGFIQDFKNHSGRYYIDINTLIITNGNHSNAIGFMSNSEIKYKINNDIKAFKFNNNILRAEFYFDKMILDNEEYYIVDYRKAILLKLSQQIFKQKKQIRDC